MKLPKLGMQRLTTRIVQVVATQNVVLPVAGCVRYQDTSLIFVARSFIDRLSPTAPQYVKKNVIHRVQRGAVVLDKRYRSIQSPMDEQRFLTSSKLCYIFLGCD